MLHLGVRSRNFLSSISRCIPKNISRNNTIQNVPLVYYSNLKAESFKSQITMKQLHSYRVEGNTTLQPDCETIVSGWVRSVRGQKGVCFIQLHDGTNIPGLQVMFDVENSSEELVNIAKTLTIGSAVSVKGIIKRNERKEENTSEGIEIWGNSIEIHSVCNNDKIVDVAPVKPSKKKQKKDLQTSAENSEVVENTPIYHPIIPGYKETPYPLQKKYQSLEFLRDQPSLKLRTNTYSAMLRIRNQATMGLHNYFQSEDFNMVHAPVITPLDCEGAGEVFSVAVPDAEDQFKSFFNTKAYLSVSGQLYAEIAASSVRKVYSFGPTFRAENSHTTRHLAEFWMLEPEMAFTDLAEMCNACEASIQYSIKHILSKCREDLVFMQERYDENLVSKLELVSTTPFARITYTEAVEILQKAISEGRTFVYPVSWGSDLKSEHERYIAEEVFNGPVFVTNYPASMKPFYMRIDGDLSTDHVAGQTVDYSRMSPVPAHAPGPTVACMDLLIPGVGELCGGSQREERFDVLATRTHQAGLSGSDYGWYLDLRRFGTVTHSGWGMGFERFLAYVSGMENVRDTVLAPRAPGLMQV